ncbi:MAG: sugar ABC transporter permease [Defluviitoga tunisiensis]|jgi:multiple sugar transport system permease protein|nr:sugar ABC transporter permease [Defluviitoga tunisiensis]
MQTRWAIFLVLPAILGFFLWQVGPMIANFVISFTDWEVGSSPQFIGFSNYKELFFDDFIFKKSMGVTFYFAIGSVIASGISAFIVALLLNQQIKFKSIFRALYFLPAIIPLVASSTVWMWLFNPNFGLLNYTLGLLGLPGSEWIYGEATAVPSLILMSVWSMGQTMIIFLAGLQGIPRQLYEAVEIDGGGWWARFAHVTIPMMTPTLFFHIVMGLIGSFQAFVQPYLMTQGGPNYQTMFAVYYIYNNAFFYQRMGYASAIATILFLIILVFTLLVFGTSSRWVYYEANK